MSDDRQPCAHAFHTYCDDPDAVVTEADTGEIRRLLMEDTQPSVVTQPARELIEMVDEAHEVGYEKGYEKGWREGRESVRCDCDQTMRWWHWALVITVGLLSGYGVVLTALWLWIAR